MAINRTFTELAGNSVTNGIYNIRYVMENGSPRFVLSDIFKSLFYKNPYTMASIFRKSLNLGKVINERDQLVVYVSKEEADVVFRHMYLITEDFKDFWSNVVIPETDRKYAALRESNQKLVEANRDLSEVNRGLSEVNRDLSDFCNDLKEKNADLAERLEELLKERSEIAEILMKTA